MEVTRQRRRVKTEPQDEITWTEWALKPVNAVLHIAWSAGNPLLRLAIPLLVFTVVIPVIVVFSLGAGWMVWSSVPTGWVQPIFLQYGDGIPHGEALIRGLVADQAYDITLHLVMPALASNFELGNFMTFLSLSTAANRTIASASKPSIVIAPSASLFRSAAKTVEHTVFLLDDFTPGVTSLLARVQVGRHDGWRSLGRGEGRELSISEAILVGKVQLRGMRAIVASFPILSTLVSTIVFFAFAVAGMLFFVGLYAWLGPSLQLQTDEPKPVVEKFEIKTETVDVPFSLLTPTTTSEEEYAEAQASEGPSTSTLRLRTRRNTGDDSPPGEPSSSTEDSDS